MNLDRMGSPGEHVCTAPCGLCRTFCSQSVRSSFPDALRMHRLAREIARFRGASDVIGDSAARVTDEQSTCARGENPSKREACFEMCSDVVAARMVGIRQEGNESLPDGTVREGTRCAKREQLP